MTRLVLVVFLASLFLATGWLETSIHTRCEEDKPCWNCQTMGNRVCGPVKGNGHD